MTEINRELEVDRQAETYALRCVYNHTHTHTNVYQGSRRVPTCRRLDAFAYNIAPSRAKFHFRPTDEAERKFTSLLSQRTYVADHVVSRRSSSGGARDWIHRRILTTCVLTLHVVMQIEPHGESFGSSGATSTVLHFRRLYWFIGFYHCCLSLEHVVPKLRVPHHSREEISR